MTLFMQLAFVEATFSFIGKFIWTRGYYNPRIFQPGKYLYPKHSLKVLQIA